MKPIEELEGEELDVAIAQEVFGWEVVRNDDTSIMAWHPNGSPAECIRGSRGDPCGCFMPSTDPAANERVLGWILGHEPEDSSTFMDACDGVWSVGYITRNDGEFQESHEDRLVCVCKFALTVARSLKTQTTRRET